MQGKRLVYVHIIYVSQLVIFYSKDISDEKNCQLIYIDPLKYVKDNPPQPSGNKTKVIDKAIYGAHQQKF